jgi:HAD superfamily hydrolase (TIGR01484 family)
MKKLIIFDLDGTLAESKSPIDAEMAALLNLLLGVAKVAVISGGAWTQFQNQLVSRLPDTDHLMNLSLLPVCGTQFYRRDAGWKELYSENFEPAEAAKIIAALNQALDQSGFRAARSWGEVIEDRGGQITLSALGQSAPLEEKRKWDPDFSKRQRIMTILRPLIPDVSIKTGGATSIDITRSGVDKAHGIEKLHEILSIGFPEMLYLGDALFPGGNDSPVKKTGVANIQVRDPHETKRAVEAIIACLGREDTPCPSSS